MCATVPHLFLQLDFDASAGYKLAPLLDKGLPILIYNGDKDYICNWIGGLYWTSALVWEGQQEYKSTDFEYWLTDDGANVAGECKKFANLTFLVVHDAGHMVPMDQPQAALEMIEQFIAHKTLTSLESSFRPDDTHESEE